MRSCSSTLVLAFVLALLAPPASPLAQDPLLGDSEAEQAARVLTELVRIESALLADAEVERAAMLARLKQASDRLARATTTLMGALDELALARAGATDPAAARVALREAEANLSQAQAEVEREVVESRSAARRLTEHVARLDGLEQRLRTLQEESPTVRGELVGVWELNVGPNDDRGTMVLRQFGTLVAGQYRLASGRDGSVRGTFASNLLRLEVIDSRLGRDATFNGRYSPDRGLSGTWEAVRLGTDRPAFGDWRAVRREEPEPPEPPEEP